MHPPLQYGAVRPMIYSAMVKAAADTAFQRLNAQFSNLYRSVESQNRFVHSHSSYDTIVPISQPIPM